MACWQTVVSFSTGSMPQCAVPGCTKQNGFKFPKNQTVCKQWVIAIKREDPLKKSELWTPNKFAVVCPSHFREDYQTTNCHGKQL